MTHPQLIKKKTLICACTHCRKKSAWLGQLEVQLIYPGSYSVLLQRQLPRKAARQRGELIYSFCAEEYQQCITQETPLCPARLLCMFSLKIDIHRREKFELHTMDYAQKANHTSSHSTNKHLVCVCVLLRIWYHTVFC